MCWDGLPPTTCLCLSFPDSHCCRQRLRAGDALCWGAGSGHGARLWEPRDGSEEEPGTSASPATPATGVTSPPCWPPETSCLLHPANQAASGASTEGGKAPTGMGVRRVVQSSEGLGMVPGELGGSSIPQVGRMQAAALPLVGAGCVCTRGCVRVCTPAPWQPGWEVCHHNLGPPSGPCKG